MAKKGYTTIDAALIKEKALPKTASTVYTDAIDCGPISEEIGVRTEKFELEIEVPELNATQLPASTSVAYQLQASDDPNFASGVASWSLAELAQTGSANGAGAKVTRFKPALESPRYWRAAATVTGTPGATIANAAFSLKHVC